MATIPKDLKGLRACKVCCLIKVSLTLNYSYFHLKFFFIFPL
jgi:transcription elongation factor SPT4